MPILWRKTSAAAVVVVDPTLPAAPAPPTACLPNTLWQIIQYFCARTGVPQPTTIFGSADQQILQIRALLEEEGTDLAKRGDWQGMTFEASHTTVAQEDQGNIATIAPGCFRYIKNDTIWDRTARLPVLGPLSAEDWQARKAMSMTGPRYTFRIRGGRLLVNPAPPAGNSWKFEYVSKHWIVDRDGGVFKQYFTSDHDTVLLPDDLLLMGLRWRWKKEKGFDYAEDFRSYEMQVKNELGRDGGAAVLCMDGGMRDARPGIFVSPGSWI